MSRCRWPVWLLLAAALLATPAGACGLQVELLYTADRLDGPPASAPVLYRTGADRAADALRVPLPQRDTGHWLRLTCRDRIDAQTDWLLVVAGAERLGTLTFHPPAAPPRRVPRAGSPDADAAENLVRRGWSLALPHGWPAASVAYLHVDGTSTEPMLLRLVRADALVRGQREEARRTFAAVSVLLAIALAMFAIYARFPDLLYLSYAGYLVCVATYALLLSGDAAAIGVLAPFLAHGPTGQWAIATLAVTLQLVFTRRILELDRLAPHGAHLLRALFWLHLALLATLLVGRARVHGWYSTAGNALLIAGVPVVLGLALLAWRRGAPYAGYYLVGWTPMFAIAALVAGNQLGVVAAAWAEPLLPPVAVAESMVLAFALSRHAANRARIARFARRSPERDALTGALNAHALEQMLESWRQLGALGARDYCLLLLDLDDFEEVNARHGHAVGDAVVRQVHARLREQLRPGDTLARIGGDRFAVVRECVHGEGEPLARRLADAVAAAPFGIDRQSLVISASVGLAMTCRGEPVGLLMQRARQALARARSLGRNAVSTAAQPRPMPAFARP